MLTPDALKSKAREWAADVVKLHSMVVPPALENEKSTLLALAKKTKTAIEAVFGSFDELDAAGLGFVPVIVGAAIAAAATAITLWYTRYNTFKEKVRLYDDLRASGTPANDAINLLNNLDSPRGFSLPSLPTFALAGGALFLLMGNRNGD